MEKKKIICSQCGAEIDEGSKFCMNCGAKLEKIVDVSSELEDNLDLKNEQVDDNVEEDVDIVDEKISEEATVEEKIVEPIECVSIAEQTKKRKPNKKKTIIAIGVAAVLLIFFMVISQPNIVSISAKYEGDTEEGIVLDSKNKGIIITGIDENGDTRDVSGWKIDAPETLQKDSSSTVDIRYKDVSCQLTVECSSSLLVSIHAEYDGNEEEGTIIDNSNTGVHIIGKYKNGTEKELESGWSIKEPVTLEADTTSDVVISYEDSDKSMTYSADTTLTITCSTRTLESISAKYTGETNEGTLINKNTEGIEVTAKYKNGVEEKIDGWTMDEEAKLKAGKTSTFTIRYENKECTLKIKCSTLSKKQFKEECNSISYNTLARDPDNNYAKMVKFKGRIVQVMEDDGAVALRVNVTNDGYGYYDDTVYVLYQYKENELKLLEDDIITFYGYSMGLESYESVMGATITIPRVYAEYIDR